MPERKALIIVDMQRDFMPDGTLPVPDSDKIIPLINKALDCTSYLLKIASKDAHPDHHISFEKWPVHCLRGSRGYEFAEGLKYEKLDAIVEKGSLRQHDSYSAFFNAPDQPGPMLSLLKKKDISELYICGVALEYCVKETILDGLRHGFKVFALHRMIKAVDEKQCSSVYGMLEKKGAVIL